MVAASVDTGKVELHVKNTKDFEEYISDFE
jgi:hypothetical protein